MPRDHEHYMRLAIEEAIKTGKAGNRAVGSVIVRDDRVVGQGSNCVVTAVDPTGHAETVALRDAAAKSGSLDFSDCTIYTTLEPCPMCCGAIAINGIPTIVIGAMHRAAERRWGDYTAAQLIELVDKGNEIITGVLAEECDNVLYEWQAKNAKA